MEMWRIRTTCCSLALGAVALLVLTGCPPEDDGPVSIGDTGPADTENNPNACEERSEEACNGVDSDNDGVVDDGCPCKFNNLSVGVCGNGVIQCDGSCSEPEFYLQEENQEAGNACDGRDNDCDGEVDEALVQDCEKQQGVCSGSTVTCDSGQGEYPECDQDNYGSNYHTPEILCDGFDNNCDGNTDQDCSFSVFNGTNDDDRLFDAETTPSGELYAVGSSNGGLGEPNPSTGPFDAFVIKHDASGEQAWLKSLETGADDQANAVDVGPSGDVVVAGETFGDITGTGISLDGDLDGFVARYDSTGNREWITSVRTDDSDTVQDVHVLPDGRVVAVGSTRGNFDSEQSQTGDDAMIAVLSSDGEDVEWKEQLASDEFAYDVFTHITVGPEGSLYAVGETEGSFIGNAQASNDSGDMVVAKYSTSGTRNWLEVFGRETSNDKALAVTPVVAESATGLWVAGQTQATVGDSGTSAGEYDGFLVRIDGSGNATDNFNFGGPRTDRIRGLTVATGGDSTEIYVLGESNGDITGSRPPIAGQVSFIARVVPGSGSLVGRWYGNPSTRESALVRRGDGGVVAVGHHGGGDFLSWTSSGGQDYYLLEHRPYPAE